MWIEDNGILVSSHRFINEFAVYETESFKKLRRYIEEKRQIGLLKDVRLESEDPRLDNVFIFIRRVSFKVWERVLRPTIESFVHIKYYHQSLITTEGTTNIGMCILIRCRFGE